ncbi:hypothetical protein H0H81_008979 [Sphagnurus paluster]|uniref:Uncharacterized protein n=1 Tax=Sphagnurus paluster TaxID=117069 RepID=A0A9P7K452_9AGAR|nr:hypothetical protein H0H81_008979 [Sphagnurus paluster]
MSAIVRQILNKIYPRTTTYRVTIIGTGWGGKTTLLYLIKRGEIVQTIPSTGFNVETIDAPTTSGKPLKLECWDVEGCADIKERSRMILPYAACGDAIMWVVDAGYKEGLAESAETLEDMLFDLDSERSRYGLLKNYPTNRKDGRLVNKQDLPDVTPMDDIRKAFAKALAQRTSCIFKTSLFKPLDQTGLLDAFEWLRFALETTAANPVLPPTLDKKLPTSSLNEKIESWLLRAEGDSDPQTFLAQFESLSLPAWDHYTHIRIAFLLLATYGRPKGTHQSFLHLHEAVIMSIGKDMIFDGIEKYITESPQTRGRTFHVTMTYFWIQIVDLAIRNISPSTDLRPSETTLPSRMAHIPSPDQFALFLAVNQYVADGNLWAEYYSKEVMMSPAAKGGMVLPDKKPLPNLVVRHAISRNWK